jgi:hypothetical protein
MARLSKNCVQAVRENGYKAVASYPQIPHSRWITKQLAALIPQTAHRNQSLPTVSSPHLPTGKKHKITDKEGWLYPLSTLPITTTITYI